MTAETSGVPGAGVRNGCEPPKRGTGTQILQEQCVRLTAELSNPLYHDFLLAR